MVLLEVLTDFLAVGKLGHEQTFKLFQEAALC